MNRFAQRLTRLEARRAPGADPYTPPEPPPGWTEEVLRLLWEHGLFETIEDMLQQVLGLTDAESIAAVKDLLADPGKETDGAELQ